MTTRGSLRQHSFRFRVLCVVLVAIICYVHRPVAAAESDAGAEKTDAGGLSESKPQPRKLRVAVAGSRPFVEVGKAGDPVGLSVDAFQEAASLVHVDYQLSPTDGVEDALRAVERGEADVAIGPISITAARADTVQFTQPYYQSSLAILAPTADTLFSKIRPFLTKTFLAGSAALVLVLMAVGSLVWLAERRKNPEQFPANPIKGIGNGLWLALVTMTTVGYGDRVPHSLAGRVVCGVWMLLSMMVASSLTAFMATALTLSQLDGPRLSQARDMKGRAVAVVEGSTSERFARSYGARLQLLPTLEDAIGLLRDGGSDAVVADRPILSYWLSQNPHSSLQLSEASYQPQGYGFALSPEAFVLRARFDQAVLKLVADGRIAELSKEWIGAN